MRSKNLDILLAMSGMAMAISMNSANGRHGSEMPDENKIRRKANAESSGKHKGLKAFEYGSGIIWAINEKTADKKAKKKGWI